MNPLQTLSTYHVVDTLPPAFVVVVVPIIVVVVDNVDVAQHGLVVVVVVVEGTANVVVATAGARRMHDWLRQTSSHCRSHSWWTTCSKVADRPHSEWGVAAAEGLKGMVTAASTKVMLEGKTSVELEGVRQRHLQAVLPRDMA